MSRFPFVPVPFVPLRKTGRERTGNLDVPPSIRSFPRPPERTRNERERTGTDGAGTAMAADLFGLEQAPPRILDRKEAAALVEVLANDEECE